MGVARHPHHHRLVQDAVAAETGLNCVIHQREALDDSLAILREFAPRVRGVFHCFVNDPATVQRVLELDSIVSFTGIATFKNAATVRDSLAAAPADQVALHDGYEAVDSVWIAPATAVERARGGTYQLRFPTQMNLQKLGFSATPGTALETARASKVVTIMSKQEKSADGKRLLRLPLEAGYGGELFLPIEAG